MEKLFKKILLFSMLFTTITTSLSCKKSDTEQKISAYAETWKEIINKGKVDLFDSAFSPNVFYDNASTHLQGIDELKKYIQGYITAFSNRDFQILEIYGSGERVIKRWSFTGTHTGVFSGIKPTGRRITMEGVTIATIRMGKIVAERDYFNDLGLMQDLGVINKW